MFHLAFEWHPGGILIDQFIELGTPEAAAMQVLQRECRVSIFTGEKDFNKKSLEQAHTFLQEKGITSDIQIAPGVGHDAAPADYFQKALHFLDQPLTKAAKTKFDEAVKAEKRKKIAEAYTLYQEARVYIKDEATQIDEALQRLEPQVFAQALKAFEQADTRKGAAQTRALYTVITDWPGTPAATQAQEALNTSAQAALDEANASPSSTKQKALLKKLLRDYPNTDAAREAQKLLDA